MYIVCLYVVYLYNKRELTQLQKTNIYELQKQNFYNS